MRRDAEDISKCLQITLDDRHIDWQHLWDDEAYVVFKTRIHSTTVYTIDIKSIARGHLNLDNQRLSDSPEISRVVEGLERHTFQDLLLIQPLRGKMPSRINEKLGQTVHISFGGIILNVATRLPDGSPGPELELTLPNIGHIYVMTRREIEH